MPMRSAFFFPVLTGDGKETVRRRATERMIFISGPRLKPDRESQLVVESSKVSGVKWNCRQVQWC